MQGTVARMRPRGVEALMDSATNALTSDNQFQVYRIEDGNEVILGTFYAKRSKGPNLICLNVLGDSPGSPGWSPTAPSPVVVLMTIQVGDLVRSI
jgi:hypothetical protein